MLPKHVLVTGGAGYVGSHTVRLMAEEGIPLVVLDNMVYGHAKAVNYPGVNVIEGSYGNESILKDVFNVYDIDCVIHFGGFNYVGESIRRPYKYYRANLNDTLTLLNTMVEFDCRKFIFSSSCSSYGLPRYNPMDEKHPRDPVHPYGKSTYFVEEILNDFDQAYGLNHVTLRYVNAAGSWGDGSMGEDHDPESHLVPILLKTAAGKIESFSLYGDDYDTADGTCVRDIIHVMDAASAHLAGYNYLQKNKISQEINIGSGCGFSVRQVADEVEKVTGKKLKVKIQPRRKGDPAEFTVNIDKAAEILEWKPEYNRLNEIIKSAWAWENGPKMGKF